MNGGGGDFFMSLLPLLVIWGIFTAIFLSIAKRKGTAVWAVIVGSFPMWAAFYGIVLASRTDRDVIDRLEKLESTSPFE
jgi:hypothetical protein